MKTVKVVAAVICDSLQEKKKLFATARGYGEFKGQWEFLGRKVEAGEIPQQALTREIHEELDTEIHVGEIYRSSKISKWDSAVRYLNRAETALRSYDGVPERFKNTYFRLIEDIRNDLEQ